jgi:hypothetical protein
MRILVLFVAVVAHGSTISTIASVSLSYALCDGLLDPRTCTSTDLSQSGIGGPLVNLTASDPAVGSVTATAAAGYGFVNVFAHPNTGVTNRLYTVQTSDASASASFNDVIHLLNVSAGMFDGLVTFTCCRLDQATGSASFSLGSTTTNVFQGSSPPLVHLIGQFSNGTIPLSGSASASAHDFAPSDPTIGASDGFASANLRQVGFTDVNGNAIQPLYFSDSGTRYFGDATYVEQASVPEPGTWLLVSLALIGVSLRHYRSRERSRGYRGV